VSERPFSDRLLAWWDGHGRKDLPWQHPRTPYRVWISEIMLQQTQVATVIPYFERFMQRFPALGTLANAALDDVLAAWSGLGYYSRARNLHRAAQICAESHGGELPVDAEGLSALPGIGASTANAIISQAHDVPAAVLDGNARRVIARHHAIAGWAGQAGVRRALWSAAEACLPARRGADYTQAIMDLGATLCTASSPCCNACPVSSDCIAHHSGETGLYPGRRPKVHVREKTLHMLILADDQSRVLLERRPPAGIWGGLWSLPEHEDEQELARQFGLEAWQLATQPEIEHRLTHLRLRIRPRTAGATPQANRVECGEGRRWFSPAEWREAGLPKPVLDLLTTHKG